MSNPSKVFFDLDQDPQLNRFLDGWVFVLGSATLFDAALRIGSGWSLHRGAGFWWNLVLAGMLFPCWVVLTWIWLARLRHSRMWTILIYPQPAAIARCAYRASRLLEILAVAIALVTTLMLVFLAPRRDTSTANTEVSGDPPA